MPLAPPAQFPGSDFIIFPERGNFVEKGELLARLMAGFAGRIDQKIGLMCHDMYKNIGAVVGDHIRALETATSYPVTRVSLREVTPKELGIRGAGVSIGALSATFYNVQGAIACPGETNNPPYLIIIPEGDAGHSKIIGLPVNGKQKITGCSRFFAASTDFNSRPKPIDFGYIDPGDTYTLRAHSQLWVGASVLDIGDTEDTPVFDTLLEGMTVGGVYWQRFLQDI